MSKKKDNLLDPETHARQLIESGYNGISPRGAYQKVLGNGQYAKLWYATMGESPGDLTRSPKRPWLFERKRDIRWKDKLRAGRLLTADQFVDLYSAIAYANSMGLVLDTHISITWNLLGYQDQTEAANALQYQFLRHLKEWFDYQDEGAEPLSYIYVHEVGQEKGFHTHILINLPIPMRPSFRVWLKNRMNQISRNGMPPRGAFHLEAPPSGFIFKQWYWFRYFCKGVEIAPLIRSHVSPNAYASAADLNDIPFESPGMVECKKKCGVSNNIGTKARKAAGYQSLLERGIADVRRLYEGSDYLAHIRLSGKKIEVKQMDWLLDSEARVQQVELADSLDEPTFAPLRDREATDRLKKIRQQRRREKLDQEVAEALIKLKI